MSELNGKTAIVTGAGQGLGLAIATAFAREDMRVVMMDINGDTLSEASESIDGETLPIQVDLSQVEPTQRAIRQALEQAGTPHVLVHNAAILNPRPILEVTLDEWNRTVNVGIQAGFLLSQAVWQGMTDAGGGSIVFVSSQSGIKGFVDETAYCTAKHGLEGLMKCLAMEGEARNIKVNTITPGMYMHTPMSEQNYPDELKQKWVDPIELTPAFVYLAKLPPTTGERLNAWDLSEEIRSGV